MKRNRHPKLSLPIGEISTAPELGIYYQDCSALLAPKAQGAGGIFLDREGIPVCDYDILFRRHPAAGRDARYGTHYTPVTIAQHALAHWGAWVLSKNSENRQRFLALARWLRERLETAPRGNGVWVHTFAFPPYNLSPPWISAMAQGQGLSVLLRGWQLTGETGYLDAARRAFGTFRHDLASGGVAHVDDAGCLWLEEFPSSPPSHVLNGFIYALWGVLDYHRVTGDPAAAEIWTRGVGTLRLNLHRYEGFYWSRYDLVHEDNTTVDYHLTHLVQLAVLFHLTKDGIFNEYFQRWLGYAEGTGSSGRLAKRVLHAGQRRLGLKPPPPVQGIDLGSSI